MKNGIYFLGAVAIAAIAGAWAMRCQIIQYEHHHQSKPVTRISAMVRPIPDPPKTLHAPHAILVLDVSGSMHTADPQRLQGEAVRQFYNVYSALGREVSGGHAPAELAVVLFSTIAQTIDWTGNGEPWLPMTAGNSQRFDRVVEAYLGRAEPDPRRGSDTDHLAALREVELLLTGCRRCETAPAVIFMTDGVFSPSGAFQTLLTPKQSETLGTKRDFIARTMASEGRALSALTTPPIFSAREAAIPSVTLDGEQLGSLKEEIVSIRNRLFTARYSGEPLRWTVVYLQADDTADPQEARAMLAGDAGSFVHCREASALSSVFIQNVGGWLQLQRNPIVAGAPEILVPDQVQGYAVQLETTPDTQSVFMHNGTTTMPLSGRGGVWAVASTQPGRWSFRLDGGRLLGGTFFYKPRFGWVLAAPKVVYSASDDVPVPVELHLFDLTTRRPADAKVAFGDGLPPGLPLTITVSPDTEVKDPPKLLRVSGDAAYRAEIPARLVPRDFQVTVQLDPLDTATYRGPLSRDVIMRPQVAPVLDAGDGPTTIDVRSVPVYGSSIRRVMKKVLP